MLHEIEKRLLEGLSNLRRGQEKLDARLARIQTEMRASDPIGDRREARNRFVAYVIALAIGAAVHLGVRAIFTAPAGQTTSPAIPRTDAPRFPAKPIR